MAWLIFYLKNIIIDLGNDLGNDLAKNAKNFLVIKFISLNRG